MGTSSEDRNRKELVLFMPFFFAFFLPQKGKVTEREEIDLKARQRPTDGPTSGPDGRWKNRR